MSLAMILLIVLVVMLVSSFPGVGIAPAGLGYYPFGGFSLVVIVLVILLLMGRI